MSKINISKKIKSKRKKLNISQHKLAELAGLSRQQIADYETGRSRPLAETYLRIMEL